MQGQSEACRVSSALTLTLDPKCEIVPTLA